MSRTIRLVAALLILSLLSLGSLNALPLHRSRVATDEGSTFRAVVSWVVSLFSGEGLAPHHPRFKLTLQIDPNGNH